MPILCKYLLKGFFKVFFLCAITLITLLLIARFQEIAKVAVAGANTCQVSLFSLYQIPITLPIVIPVSTLLATFILFQRLSSSSEITALRSFGISLWKLSFPLIVIGSLFSLTNFFIASEVTPLTRTALKTLLRQAAVDNPLVVMQKNSSALNLPLTLDNPHFEVKNLIPGKKAEEILCIALHKSHNRIGIFTVKEISLDPQWIFGTSISLISSKEPTVPSSDHLIVKNQENMQMDKQVVMSHILETKQIVTSQLLTAKKSLDLIQKIYVGILPLTCTLIGIAFGININRNKRKNSIFLASFLFFLLLGSLTAAKILGGFSLIALPFYLIPHPISLLISLYYLRRISKGELAC